MELKNIRDFSELYDFLDYKGRRHRNYHHYTSIRALTGILTSKHLYLSRADKMNDKQEITKGNRQKWENIFISSFTTGENESIAMWGIYGVPREEAVRISFPAIPFTNWIKPKLDVYRIDDACRRWNDLIDESEINEIKLSDVIYASGNRGDGSGSIKWRNDMVRILNKPWLKNISSTADMTGYIKNIAWAYENEVRIKVVMKNNDNIDKIAIRIPEEILENIEITLGPWANEETNNIEVLRNLKSKNSNFHKLVKLSEPCHYCAHGRYTPK